MEKIEPLDRRLRKQVELHGVAERLIEARTIEIDCQPLGLSLERGGGEPAIDDVRLERVALRFLQRNPRYRSGQRAKQVRMARAADIRRCDTLSFVEVESATGRGDDDLGGSGIFG